MSNLFKTSKAADAYRPPGFAGGGLVGNFLGMTGAGGGLYDVKPTGIRADLVSGLSDAGGNAADNFQTLYNTVAPGYNDLLRTRIDQINNSAGKAIGDLRQNLASRRVLGSSFGNDTINRLNAEFSAQRDQATADTFLKSLDAQRQLTADTFNARQKQFQAGLDELNLEAGIATNLAGQANTQLATNARTDAQLQTGTNQKFAGAIINGIGSIAGMALGPSVSQFGNSLAGGFGGGGGGGSVTAGSYGGIPYPIFGAS